MQQISLLGCVRKGLVIFGLGLLLGCSSSHGPELIASTSPLAPGVRGTVPASGSDCQTFLLGLLPVTTSPNTQDALSMAKKSAGAEVLTDVTVDENSFYWILFSHRCIRVRGLGVAPEKELGSVGSAIEATAQ